MKKPLKQRLGVTLVELLLVVILMLILASVGYPLVSSHSFAELNDVPAINLLKDALAHASSMGFIARDKESQLSFKTGDSFFYRADNQMNLPKGYEIGKILADGTEIGEEAVIKFKLSGQILVNGSFTDKVEIEVKRGNNLVDSVETRSMFFDIAWQSGSSS